MTRSIKSTCEYILSSISDSQELKSLAMASFGAFDIFMGQRGDALPESPCVISFVRVEKWERDHHTHSVEIIFAIGTKNETEIINNKYSEVPGFVKHLEFLEATLDFLASLKLKFSSVSAIVDELWPLYVSKISIKTEVPKPIYKFGG